MLRQAYNVSRANRTDAVRAVRPNDVTKDFGFVRACNKVGLTTRVDETKLIFASTIYSESLAVPAEPLRRSPGWVGRAAQ